MASVQLQNLVDLLAVRGCQPKPTKDGFTSLCPGHDDTKPSLKIKDSTKGVLIKCWAGLCDNEHILNVLGIKWEDLFYQPLNNSKPKNTASPLNNGQSQNSKETRKKKPSFFTSSENENFSSKRVYKNLAEYAEFKGVSEEVFLEAGWENCLWNNIKAIKIPTEGGNRYRLLNNGDNKFVCDKEPKFVSTWYKLDQAIEIAQKENQALIWSNGEPSTVIGQFYNLAAFAVCASESSNVPSSLIEQLKGKWHGSIIIPIDNDNTGLEGGLKRQQTLNQAGFEVILVRFETNIKGYDLADFCKDNLNLDATELYKKLIELKKVDTENKEINNQSTVNIDNSKPTIMTSEQLGDIFEQARTAFAANNSLPTWFRKQSKLVKLVLKENGQPGGEFEQPDQETVMGHLAASANWIRKGKKNTIINTTVEYKVARHMIVNPPEVPIIDSVIATPVFASNGDLINEFGYNEEHKTFLAASEQRKNGKAKLTILSPTYQDVERAKKFIFEDWLGGFPFPTEIDKANILAPILTPFTRQIIRGLTPLFLIEAPQKGTGKTLLASTISIVAAGKPAEVKTYPNKEEEIRKVITTELMKGEKVILFDNINGWLNSDALATVLTSYVWSDRLLNYNKTPAFQNNALWLATGNNVTLGTDFVRRTIRIRIDANVEKPWMRQQFTQTDLSGWVDENKEHIVNCCLIIIKSWIDKGQINTNQVAFGSFQSFANVIGSIITNAGINGFLQNLSDLDDESSYDREWKEFVDAWIIEFGSTIQRTQELFALCIKNGQQLMSIVRKNGNEASQVSHLGQSLTKNLKRVFGEYKIMEGKIKVNGHTRHGYYLEKLNHSEK